MTANMMSAEKVNDAVDSDDVVVYERPAYRFLYAEVDYQSDVYVLNNGKWYKVSRTFVEQVNSFFATAPKYTASLTVYNDEAEGVTVHGQSAFSESFDREILF